ncbi:hypothetical protein [Roseivirga sp. E12]|uniref:hypothetical protein n=1 Tax=Roseivirga sp. E12 TaxID=2819237 RepID=UPI001ABC4416|nr:hypothetical protein [Roseivirga sp. E12]MBO3698159.1 hypothetical protein [Roseivirga sp. E12]
MKRNLVISVLLIAPLLTRGQERANTTKMQEHFNTIESLIPKRDSLNVDVSSSNVAWHIDHMLKVVNKIYDSLAMSDPAEYRYQLSLARPFVFLWGDFPRGIAKSPKVVLPPDDIKTEDLYAQLEEARTKVQKMEDLPKKSFFYHFAFKNLNRRRTKRFLEVHTKHHLKIVRDILKD